ncbi:peroxiredoxin [Liquorilactobacillus capillatus]|uniref:peroxiredoxin n=1 Tax=Liquorilactobacillus capillatus TaxID=480931 RepID=UPI00070A7712|nr:peroxiredoxin [Liquorilactobacillus capillatus]
MEIAFHGEAGQTNGTPFKLGEVFPHSTLKNAANESIDITAAQGKFSLISVVPDINTRVCSLSTKRFNQEVDKFTNINFYTVSTNTVAEQQQWCAAEGVTKMVLLSDATGQLGKELGIYIAANKIDARSIWILDEAGTIVYRELIVEQTNEPDYQSALAFLREHAE